MNLFHEVADDFLELYFDDVDAGSTVNNFTDEYVPCDIQNF